MLLALGAGACGSCGAGGEGPGRRDLGTGAPSRANASAPRAPTALDRLDALNQSPPEVREAVRRRATLRSDAREQVRDGNPALALRALEDALRGGPTAELHCEAAAIAMALDDLESAQGHLASGLGLAIEPRLRARCLHLRSQLARRLEQPAAAAAALREAIALRPNGVLARELATLEAARDPESGEVEAGETAEVHAASETVATAEASEAAPYASWAGLCESLRCDEAISLTAIPAPPASWAPIVELRLVAAGSEPLRRTWLAARRGTSWQPVAAVASRHPTASYGALDATEAVTAARFEGPVLHLEIAGVVDERTEEAEHYLACAAADEEAGALRSCFAAATTGLAPPDSWTRELVFSVREGSVVLEATHAGPATQADRAPTAGRRRTSR